MSSRKRGGSVREAHFFGGDWTASKLEVLSKYLESYTTALQNKPFKTAYIDAFAGTGYRALQRSEASEELLFPDLAEEAPQALLDGSARLALKVQPRFDKYIFIESHGERCEQLFKLRDEFSDIGKSIEVRRAEANAEIRRLCSKSWRAHRAVLFLDPYGMQVEWSTIESIAQTQAIDLWLLFPLGIGVNRLLKRSGEIPDSWRARLDILLGTSDWFDTFYKINEEPTLFGSSEPRLVKASMEEIGRYFNNRLKSIFPGVAEEPKVLFNRANCPLYLLCFAVGNKAGAPIALRIANHLLKTVA